MSVRCPFADGPRHTAECRLCRGNPDPDVLLDILLHGKIRGRSAELLADDLVKHYASVTPAFFVRARVVCGAMQYTAYERVRFTRADADAIATDEERAAQLALEAIGGYTVWVDGMLWRVVADRGLAHSIIERSVPHLRNGGGRRSHLDDSVYDDNDPAALDIIARFEAIATSREQVEADACALERNIPCDGGD